MIIQRKLQKKIHPKDLYFVSSLGNLDNTIIYPEVPNNLLTRNGWEDTKTKRIVLYPSVSEALIGLGREGRSLKGAKLYVYSPLAGFQESLIKPGIKDSPIIIETGEYWYLSSIKLKLIAEIEVEKKIPGEEIIYHYGPRSTIGYLYRWKWKEILKPWEKEGKLKEKEFGIVSDLYHSGLNRTYKKYVGRARRSLGNKLGKSIEKDTKELEKVINTPRKLIINSNAGETLGKVSKDNKLKINTGDEREILNTLMSNDRVDLTGKRDFTLPSKKVKEGIEGLISENYKRINKGKSPTKDEIKNIIDKKVDDFTRGAYRSAENHKAIIQLGDRSLGESPEILAHEIGHNISNKSLKGKLINRASRNDFKNFDPKRNDNSGEGILKGIKKLF